MNYLRLILGASLLLSVIFGWWFICIVIALFGTWLFPWYIEALIAGLIYDSLFGHLRELGIWAYAGTILALAIYISIWMIRSYIRR